MAKHHYVYNSFEEWGRGYIGIRSCDCLPEEDTTYFGSFRDKSFNPTKKDILFVRETRQEVAEIEIKLHDFFDVAVNPRFANQAKQTNTGFDRAGVPNSEEQKKKIGDAMSGRAGTLCPMYGRTGAASNRSKAIIAIEPDGTELHFVSGTEAARELKIPHSNLRYYLKTGNVLKRGKFKGWQFFYENL